jgi:hypothetical protein
MTYAACEEHVFVDTSVGMVFCTLCRAIFTWVHFTCFFHIPRLLPHLLPASALVGGIEAPLSARSALQYLGNFIGLLTAFMWQDLTRAYRTSEADHLCTYLALL